MTNISLWQGIRRRTAAVRDSADQGMMAVVVVVMIIGMGLAALMTPLVLGQSASTGHTDSRVQALQTAETGVNAALGLIRSATSDGGTTGTATALPCFSVGSPLTGAQTPGSTSQYTVSLAYFASDPLQITAATGALPVALNCKPGAGLTDSNNVVTLPSFARITATGVAGSGNTAATRTLAATYSFNSNDIYNPTNTTANIQGGLIRFNPRGTATPAQCLDANTTTPAVGGHLVLNTCGAVTYAQQQFTYTTDLTLRFVGPASAAAPYGLCVDATSTDVTFVGCARPGLATYDSQWSFTGVSAFAQTRPDTSTWCLAGNGNGANVAAKPCTGSYDTAASWLPTPYVGAGAAGAGLGQLVNLSQFARCAQDTRSVDSKGAANALTILYPCEQLTSAAKVDGYQKFAFDPTTGHWVTSKANDATSYCLTSPGTVNGLVTLTACSAGTTQKWTDFGAAAADQANASQYPAAKRYTIVDSSTPGLCLSLGAPSDLYSISTSQFSKLTTATCDGSAQQKWNADPSTSSSVLKNVTEK